MKKKTLTTFIGLAGLGLCSTLALTLTSCASKNPSTAIKVKELNMSAFNGLNTEHTINIKDITKEVDIDPLDLVYGTNSYNGGKYMFIYGTLGRTEVHLKYNQDNFSVTPLPGTVSEFYTWLTGYMTNSQQQDIIYDNYQNFNIGNTFFDAWFNDNPETYSPYKDVKILTYIDIPPVNEFNKDPNASDTLDNVQMADPFSTWSEDDVLAMYNWKCKKDLDASPGLSYAELPFNWKMMTGTYIRQDESAEQYRRLISYIEEKRPGISAVKGSDFKNSGVIGFNTTSKSPFTGSLEDINIGKFGSSGGTQITEPGNSWKDIYNMYNGKSWEDEEADKEKEEQESTPAPAQYTISK